MLETNNVFSHKESEAMLSNSDWRKEQHQWWKENMKGHQDED